MTSSHLEHFGNIDIYLFDQILRGRVRPGMVVLDAGCGAGRNLSYFLREGYEVFAIDENPEAIGQTRTLKEELHPTLSDDNLRVEPLESATLDADSIDFIINSAVLHFARDTVHFEAMLSQMVRLLKPGGVFFCRTASLIGLETLSRRMERLSDRRFRLPDGSVRYLVDEAQLIQLTEAFPGRLMDPLKTTVVQGQRSMTTWVVQKQAT